jgi:hypothetical protein
MPCIEKNDFGVRQIVPVSLSADGQEMCVFFAPDSQQRWAMRAEIFLKCGVERDIVAIIKNQVKLDFIRAR